MKFVGWKVYIRIYVFSVFSSSLSSELYHCVFPLVECIICDIYSNLQVLPISLMFILLTIIDWHVIDISRYYPCICLIRMRVKVLPWKPTKIKEIATTLTTEKNTSQLPPLASICGTITPEGLTAWRQTNFSSKPTVQMVKAISG